MKPDIIKKRRPLPSDDEDEYNEEDEMYEDDNNNYEEDEDDDDDDDEDDEDDDENEEELIKQQLSNVSFSSLLKYKKNGPTDKLNLNTITKNLQQQKSFKKEEQQEKEEMNSKNKYKIKRESSDAPVEMTAMKPVSRFRQVVVNKTKMNVRDPRFDSLSGGKYNEDLYRKRYGFLDDVIKRDVERMESTWKQMDDCRERDQLYKKIQSKKSQLKTQQLKDQKRETKNKLWSNEIESVKKGKTPYHISNKTVKQFELQEKFKQLKASNKLDKFMETKRKRISSKEKTFLPQRRSFDQDEN
ncbi:hypothetical protein DDB_G0278751 [Dictyostelium discoideum AX4]|uniref:Ribosomal RNA processing protein 36 homolog n=1 Tax=Dictyostelium discoideum TaxID=44689 RepID=RRP36_DICDI|nr:hypothetical protein DDB_G0278751 [Dictyostelium discoideum AX4]Q54XT8.1 RecName: Full=Ribosomal RNA processing protein 36 homolog [Dictyostelium discoideum]EAL67977.1 hypothetical protein DDB_G0278751 [Dictyostelium discoideum AX4]|eukprot:XP_641913.1 hypothetical protein DDB_G0278751 [Dictyostelium discoideum AX4]